MEVAGVEVEVENDPVEMSPFDECMLGMPAIDIYEWRASVLKRWWVLDPLGFVVARLAEAASRLVSRSRRVR